MSGRAWPKPTGEESTDLAADPAGLVSWLLEEGARLGFHVERDYTGAEGDSAEAAWFLNPGQKPVLAFTVEEADPMRLIAAAMQWAGSSTEPKSWVHVCLSLLAELSWYPLPEGVRVYDAQRMKDLRGDLEEEVDRMVQLLRPYLVEPPSDGLPEAVKRLSSALRDWPEGRENARMSLDVEVSFSTDGLSPFAAENAEDEEAETPILEPSRKVVPVELSSGGSAFEGFLLRLVGKRSGRFLFSTEHRNYPFIFRIEAPPGRGSSTLDLWFDVDKSNIPQILRFRELVEDVTLSKSAVLLGPSGEMCRLTLA